LYTTPKDLTDTDSASRAERRQLPRSARSRKWVFSPRFGDADDRICLMAGRPEVTEIRP